MQDGNEMSLLVLITLPWQWNDVIVLNNRFILCLDIIYFHISQVKSSLVLSLWGNCTVWLKLQNQNKNLEPISKKINIIQNFPKIQMVFISNYKRQYNYVDDVLLLWLACVYIWLACVCIFLFKNKCKD